MAIQRKLMSAAAAVSLAAVIAAGTYAWTNLSPRKINEWRGAGSPGTGPGGTLHDDRRGSGDNKDVYVENWGDRDLFVRVKLTEYMEAGQGAGLKSVSTEPNTDVIIHNPLNLAESITGSGDIDHTDTWADIRHRFFAPGDPAPASEGRYYLGNYWNWEMGGQKYYYPASADLRKDKNYVDQSSPDNLTAGSVNDNGINARLTHPAAVMTMNDWKNAGQPIGDYWIIDNTSERHIWAYWAAPLKPGEATGLLINKVALIDSAFNTYGAYYDFGKGYYYAVNVIAQMATKDGTADSNGVKDNYERFGDANQGGWSADGQALMEKLVNADTAVDAAVYSQTYIAFGDSVPAGYALADPETESYVSIFAKELEAEGKTISVSNMAVSGMTSAQLLDALNNLTAAEKDKLANSDIVTVNIGGNNILGPIIKNLNQAVNKLGIENVREVTSEQIKNVLPFLKSFTPNAGLLTDLQDGLAAFNSDFPIIITEIKAMAPHAVLIVSTVYNPIPPDISAYSTVNSLIKSINSVILEGRLTYGYEIADTYAAFENAELEGITVTNFNLDPAKGPLSVDIHPNATGHAIIAQLHLDLMNGI